LPAANRGLATELTDQKWASHTWRYPGDRIRGGARLSLGVLLYEDLASFVADQARQLRPGERLPACSEVIETCFGKFKSLEREQAKGGFTGLLLALAACVAERTQEVVHEALQTTKTGDVIA
jgi:hypothetical protein